MKVKEVIAELLKQDQEAEVFTYYHDAYIAHVDRVVLTTEYTFQPCVEVQGVVIS